MLENESNHDQDPLPIIQEAEEIAHRRFNPPMNVIFGQEHFQVIDEQLYRCSTEGHPEKYEGKLQHVPLQDLIH